MEPLTTTQFTLLLHSLPGMGERTLASVLRSVAHRRLSAEQILENPDSMRQCGAGPAVCAHLLENRAALMAKSAELARLLRDKRVQVTTLAMAAYPERLTAFDDAPPPVLYALGRADLLETANSSRFTFAMAVSNGAATIALETGERIAMQLVDLGGIPVTGHDRPAYQRVALCAQRQSSSVIYLFDRGLREVLGPDLDRPPFAAARIRDVAFATERDLALSPFRLDDHSIGANNRRRDRLVFALADAIVALHVRPSGSMAAECERAVLQGRAVFTTRECAFPGATVISDLHEAAGVIAEQSRTSRR